MSIKHLAPVFLVAALAPVACQMVAGLDGDFKAAPEVDAGTSSVRDAGEVDSGMQGCARATYVDPPAAADGPSLPDIILAMRTIDLGESATTPPGYDLDGTCTCFGGAGPTCAAAKNHCDAPGGIDNGSAQFFSLVQFAAGPGNFSSAAFSAKIEQGVFGVVVRLSKYSGEEDDSAVEVAIYPSGGVTGAAPLWDGNDAWQIQSPSLVNDDPDQPLFKSDGAYVSKGTLVAALPALEAKLGGEENSMVLHLTGGVLTGKLSKDTKGFLLTEGIIAARWRIQDIFGALSSYRDNQGKPICTDVGFAYESAKDAICNGLDILGDPSGAKTQDCDALSIGLGFTAQAARLGAVTPPPMPFPGCPMESDPQFDSCH